MTILVYLLLFKIFCPCMHSLALPKEPPKDPKSDVSESNDVIKPINPEQHSKGAKTNDSITNHNLGAPKNESNGNLNPPNTKTDGKTHNSSDNHAQGSKDGLESGAFLRGFYVFAGLSALVLIYFLFRSYRIRHNTQSTARVKKYGVITRRNAVEMQRLESEDDEEESIFDVGEHRGH